MNPESPAQTQEPSPGQRELLARKERALMLVLMGIMLCIFSTLSVPPSRMMPPIVVDEHGRPVLDADGRMLQKPTTAYYVMTMLSPWNISITLGLGLIAAAGVVRFRRRAASSAQVAKGA